MKKLKPSHEVTRVTQLYWGTAPILLLQHKLSLNQDINVGRLLDDPLSRHKPGQDAHIMCIYAASLLRRAIGLKLLSDQKAEIIDFIATLRVANGPDAGGFRATLYGECDTRTTYVALASAYMNGMKINA